MKKIRFFALAKFLTIMMMSSLFMTCDPGLGKAVDTQAPKVSVSFPVTKSVLKGGFMMKGVASDEVKVERCVVTFRNMDTSDEYNFTASVTKGEFSVNINSPESDGSFELPDGDYNVTVTVSDAYRISTADVVYTIDNTAPTVLLTSPNVYVASNWPSMYKLFTIKGEVYDFTNIEEVKVYIVDSDGNVLAEKVAEGTNTFLASFENPPIPTGKTCFYYAVAKDAGKNENTYCYHKQDIYALLSQQQKSSTFPSINAIGYVDQKVRENFNDSIDNELLGTKKIENKNPSSEKGSRPGFDFFDKDTAQIKWLNISEESLAGIGIGTPVLGTIMPPTDGSAVLDVEVWVVKSSDGGTTFAEFNEENKLETCWLTYDTYGNIIDEKQCKLSSVGDSVNFQIDSHDVGSGDEWPSSVYKVKVKFVTNSDMEGYAECIFQVTSGAPKLTEGNFSSNPSASYYRGFMTAQTLASGKNYLKGISKTSDEESAVPLKYEISGSSVFADKAETDADGNYEIEIPIDAVNHANDGEYTYSLTAEVSDILSTVISRVVVIDTTNPVVNFTNLTNEQVVPSKDFVVRGNVEDANGISKVEYQLFADGNQIALDGTSSGSGWILLPGVNGSFELSLKNLNKDVNYELKIRTTDAAGNTTGEQEYKRQFTLDNTNPEIKVNSVSPQIEYQGKDTVNGSITVNLSVTDTNTIKEFYYTFDNSVADDSNWSAQGNKVKSFDSTSGVQKLEIDTTEYSDGSELPLRIKAVDEAGNSSVVKVNPVVNQESDKPSISPSNFEKLGSKEAAGWQGVTSTNVFGKSNPNMIFTVADDDLVKEYYAKLNNGQFKKIGDVNSAQKIVTYPLTEIIENYERHKITLRIVDDKYVNDSSTPNNYVEEVFYIAIDDGQPELRLNNANGQFVGNEFTISGIATDRNGIEYVTLQSEGGNVYSTLGIDSGLENGNFSYTFRLNELTTKDPIIVTAVDKIGNASTTTFTYRVDSTPPTVNFDRNEVGYVDGDSPNLKLQGYAIDGEKSGDDNDVSKIDQVRVKIGSPVTSINDENSILATGKVDDNGKMTWSALLDFAGYEAGKYTVYAAAFDFAGNMSEVQDSVEIPVDADTPKIESSYVQDVSNSPILISGQASDNSGIKSVSAKVQGSQKDIVVNYNQTSDETPSDWSFYVPTDAGQGQLTIVVTATDVCGKSTNETFVAVIDTEVPEVTFTDISDDDSNNETIETSKTNDKPSVAVTYSDKTSGVKTLAYEFYYFDRTKGEFVNYATKDKYASGTFTRNGSFSGSVKLRMAEQTTVDSSAFIYPDTYTDGKWYVKVTVTDEAENKATYNSPYFYVDQHKPTLDVTSPADLSLKKQNDALTVSGSTSDNFNGEIDKVVVKVTHPNYNQSQLDQFTKTFTKDGSNGTQLLTQIGSDEKYSFEYTWNESNSPFKFPNEYEVSILTYDKAGNETPVTRKVSCDSTAPTISFSRPYSYSVDAYGNVTKGSVVNSPIGDTSIKALANDYSMDSIYYQVGGTVKIESTGTLGQSDYKIKKLTVTDGGVGTDDYGISYTNPSSDNLAAGVLVGVWNKLTVANFDFDVSYNTLTFNNSGKTYHVDGDKETIMTLDVHFVAVDEAGNVNYCKMPIKVDTDTDKPNLLILSPKTVNDVANVGGTATVSGTVNDDNSVHSVWMQVELANKDEKTDSELANYVNNILTSSDGTKTFGIDYSNVSTYNMSNSQVLVENNNGTYSLENSTSYFTDRTKWYRVNLGAPNSKSTTWNMVLNKFKEFDNKSLYDNKYLLSQVAQTELIVRVRSLDTKSGNDNISTDAKLGDISEFRLKIDSGSPSIVINNIGEFPTEGSYIGGTLNFDVDFSDDESITEYSIIAYSSASGDNRSYTITEGSNVNGYGPNVPIRDITVDTQNIYNACGNMIQIKFFAKDKSKDTGGEQIAAKESYLTFKYTIDNSAPEANNVATIDRKNYRISTESVDGSDIRESEARNSHLRILSDQAAFIGNVKDEDNGSGVDYVMLYFTKDGYLYNPSQNNVKESLSNKVYLHDENGNQVEVDFPVSSLNDIARAPSSNGGKVTPYIVIDRAEGMNDSGSNGDLDGYDENLKANGDWVVYIKSSNLPDGIYDIHYVVVDFAGNARYYSDTMLVQNHAPTINSIVLATDIDGDGIASITFDGSSDEDQKFFADEFDETGFVVRNSKLKIKVNVTGGTGTLKYYLRYKTTNGEVTTNSSNPGYSTGEFEVTDFLGDSATPVDYVVWVEDSVEQNLSLSSGKNSINMIMDNEDDVAPVAQFFELNTIVEDSATSNEERGSLFKANGSVKGHIEPRQYSLVDNGSVSDPEVSGTIILRGEAMDDQRIGSITLTLGNKTKQVAVWDGTSLKAVNENGENRATLITNELGLSGHYVEWSYVWDTWDITNNVGYDTAVKLLVTDYSDNSRVEKEYSAEYNIPRTESNKFDKTTTPWGYNNITVDVVPYITKIETPNRALSGLKKNNIRSASGKYSVIKGNTADFIKVYGFNLNASAVRIVDSTEVYESVSASTGNSLTTKAPSSPYNELSLSNNSSVSGYLEIIVNGVRSINNINDNEQDYNQEPDESIKNTLLNDDRYLLFFNIKDTGIRNGYYPTMVMEGNNPVFGYLDKSGGKSGSTGTGSGTGAGSFYPAYAMPQRAKFDSDGKEIYVEYLAKNSVGDLMGMGKDDSGRYHHVTVFDRDKCAMYYVYDRYAELVQNGAGWAPGVTIGTIYDFVGRANNNGLALESVNYKGLMTGRYMYPKVVAKGDSINDKASVYMAYYDDFTKEILLRNFQVGKNSAVSGTKYALQTTAYNVSNADNDGRSFGQYVNFAENTCEGSPSATYSTGRLTAVAENANYSPSRYFDIKVTSDNHIIIVYYDQVTSSLQLLYSNNAIIGATPTSSVAWTRSSVNFPLYVGTYVSMDLDKEDGIHITAFDANDSDLYYMYLPKYDSQNLDKMIIDQYGSVGHWTQIKIDRVHTSSKYYNKPVVAYYNSTETGGRDSIKLAYVDSNTISAGVDSNGYVTGSWEFMTVPALTSPQGGDPKFQNVCLDFDSTGKPIIGYLGENLEFGSWCDE